MPQRSELHGATQPESYSRQDENVPRFFLASALDSSTTALNHVYQAAEVFCSIEDRARETEARAQSLCRSAVERLKFAEQRIEAESAGLTLGAHLQSAQIDRHSPWRNYRGRW